MAAPRCCPSAACRRGSRAKIHPRVGADAQCGARAECQPCVAQGLDRETIRLGEIDGSTRANLDPDLEARQMTAELVGYQYLWMIEPKQTDLETELPALRDRMTAKWCTPPARS